MASVSATKLDSISFDDLIAQQKPFGGTGSSFDLRAFQFISPAALVQLAAACHALKANSQQPLILIEDPSLRSYLSRAGFVAAVREVADFSPPLSPVSVYDILRGSNRMLIEVTKIQDGAELPPLLDQIVEVLRQRLRYRKPHAFDIATAVSEICQNTFDHNTNTCGFMAMQVFGRGKKQFLEIGVADHGLGLAGTLSRNPKIGPIRSDLHAIEMATKPRISEHDDPTRGTGLFHLLEIAYEHAGSVQIRSGEGKVRYRMDRRRGWSFVVSGVPGVQIALTLRTKRA